MEISNFEQLIKSLVEQRAETARVKALHSDEVRKEEDIEAKIMEVLKEEGKDSYKSEFGTVSISHRTSFKIPGSPEEKKLFWDYLREKGVFENLITVNSNTLNSFCKTEREQAIEEGRGLEFNIPGIQPPVINEVLSLRKA